MFHHIATCAMPSSSTTTATAATTTVTKAPKKKTITTTSIERKVSIHSHVIEPTLMQFVQPQSELTTLSRVLQQQQQQLQECQVGTTQTAPSLSSPSERSRRTESGVTKPKVGTASPLSSPSSSAISYSRTMAREGMAHYNSGQYDMAVQSFRSVAKKNSHQNGRWKKDLSEGDNNFVIDYRPFIAQALTSIGSAYLERGELEIASEVSLEALQLIQRVRDGDGDGSGDDQGMDDDEHDADCAMKNNFNDSHPSLSTVGVLNNLGTIAMMRNDLDTSLKYYRAALIDARRHLGRRKGGSAVVGDDYYATDVAKTLHNIGRVLMLQQRWSPALSILTEALRVEEKLYPTEGKDGSKGMKSKAMSEHNIHHVDTLNMIGFVHYMMGELDEALITFAEVLSIARRRHGLFHDQVATSLAHVAMVMERQGRLVAACKSYRTAMDIFSDLECDQQEDHHAIAALTDTIQKIEVKIRDVEKPSFSGTYTEDASCVSSKYISDPCDSLDDCRQCDDDDDSYRAGHENHHRDSEDSFDDQEDWEQGDSRDDDNDQSGGKFFLL